jgi:putative mRNA 3-end processing factor
MQTSPKSPQSSKAHPAGRWLYPRPEGLFCEAGGFYVDPNKPVDKAVITHGHADHARRGHGAVLATPETIAIMKLRYGEDCAGVFQHIDYGQTVSVNGVNIRIVPAGHILGSAQVVLEHNATRVVVSGDYKRVFDPTCEPFELVPCDVFVTEATFALPVFRHEPAVKEARRLIESVRQQPERTHMLGVYGLGKCQRMIALLRQAGFEETIHLHGALVELTQFYEQRGFTMGSWRPIGKDSSGQRQDYAGQLVMCPPSAISDRWSRRFPDPATAFASGWMRVRGRARQYGVELPLIVSDHADWPELIATIKETGAEEVWVTHGREDALVHQLGLMGIPARALALVGFDDEGE